MAPTTDLEERVLEAFRNDPILSERAIDIGAIGEGIIELTGWVDTEDEADARGDARARRAGRRDGGQPARHRRRGGAATHEPAAPREAATRH